MQSALINNKNLEKKELNGPNLPLLGLNSGRGLTKQRLERSTANLRLLGLAQQRNREKQ